MEFLLALILGTIAQEDTDNTVSALDFAELFQRYYPRVYNYLRYRVGALEDAEDLLGVVFEKAYTHREQFEAQKGAFSTWLFRIAHNELANYYRARERRSKWEADGEMPNDLVTPEASPETQVIRQESVARLLQGLAQLSERDQTVISLKFGSRLNNQEIGQIMDLKEKTVSVVLLRAMRRLQKQLEETV
ncbi:MAG: sigma-70 family RNA polymerase sigma factor [Anaerolineae bacterium]|nr:sigma-70 family RNA polymerase sigma factor [Anaerolineae bacterium]